MSVDFNDPRLPQPEDDKDAQIAKLKTVVAEQEQRIIDAQLTALRRQRERIIDAQLTALRRQRAP